MTASPDYQSPRSCCSPNPRRLRIARLLLLIPLGITLLLTAAIVAFTMEHILPVPHFTSIRPMGLVGLMLLSSLLAAAINLLCAIPALLLAPRKISHWVFAALLLISSALPLYASSKTLNYIAHIHHLQFSP